MLKYYGFDWASIKGDTTVLRILSIHRKKRILSKLDKFFISKTIYGPPIFAYYSFPKIQPINSDRVGFKSQSCAIECQN